MQMIHQETQSHWHAHLISIRAFSKSNGELVEVFVEGEEYALVSWRSKNIDLKDAVQRIDWLNNGQKFYRATNLI